MPDPTVRTVDSRGYDFDETSPCWKEECQALPCFKDIRWPDYDTWVVEDVIDGQPVVIQLWKGWCQQFLGRSDFPGGIGAEVGVYRRIPGKALPTDLSFVPLPLRILLLGVSRIPGADLWWPFPELETTVRFSLVNPVTGNVLCDGTPEVTYWRNLWIEEGSYQRYKRDQNGQVPQFSTGYRLDYSIISKSGQQKDYSW
jgi:hypothetical protein